MRPGSWRHLDPQALPDWPLSAQLCLLLAALLCSWVLTFVLFWQQDITELSDLGQQNQERGLQRNQLLAASRQITTLSPWLPLHGLGCRRNEILTLAAQHQLSISLGPVTDETTHGHLVEASVALLINAPYPALWHFLKDLAQGPTVWVLDPLSLAHGPEKLVELQARVRCVRQPEDAQPK